MKFYNRIDDKGRFMGLTVDPTQNGEQRDSHGISAKFALDQMRDIGHLTQLGDLNDDVWRRKEAAAQIADIRHHYQEAVAHNVVPPTVPLRVYVSEIYLRPHSIMPALFRYRLQHGAFNL